MYKFVSASRIPTSFNRASLMAASQAYFQTTNSKTNEFDSPETLRTSEGDR
jgi:hypothetical protein